MSLHTARVIPEKRFSCPPAAVHFAGVEEEIDMKDNTPKLEFAIGDCAAVSIGADDEINLSFLAWQCSMNKVPMHKFNENAELVDVGPITPEQAYLLGKSLLLAAKHQGISE